MRTLAHCPATFGSIVTSAACAPISMTPSPLAVAAGPLLEVESTDIARCAVRPDVVFPGASRTRTAASAGVAPQPMSDAVATQTTTVDMTARTFPITADPFSPTQHTDDESP